VIEHARRVLRRRYAVPQGARLSSTVRPMRQTGDAPESGPADAARRPGRVPLDPPGPTPLSRRRNAAQPRARRRSPPGRRHSTPSSCLMPSSVALSTNLHAWRARFFPYASARRHSARIQPEKGLGGTPDAHADGWHVLSATHGSIRQECEAALGAATPDPQLRIITFQPATRAPRTTRSAVCQIHAGSRRRAGDAPWMASQR
jgi:hypothetical protein